MFLSQYLTTPAAPHISVEDGYFLPLPKDLVRKGNIFTQSSSLESFFTDKKCVLFSCCSCCKYLCSVTRSTFCYWKEKQFKIEIHPVLSGDNYGSDISFSVYFLLFPYPKIFSQFFSSLWKK